MKTIFKLTTNSVSDSNLSFRNVDSQTEKQLQYAQFMDVHSWKSVSEAGEESKVQMYFGDLIILACL